MIAPLKTKQLLVASRVLGITGLLVSYTPTLGAAPAAPATEHAGAHILLSYKGATRARPEVTRTKEEARNQAMALLVNFRKQPAPARDLACRLYATCERKGWAEEARAYNGLVVAWPELEKLAARVPCRGPKQESLP